MSFDQSKVDEVKMEIIRFQAQYDLTLDVDCIDALCLYIVYGLEMGGFLTALYENNFIGLEQRMHPMIRQYLTSYLAIMTALKQKYGEKLDKIREEL